MVLFVDHNTDGPRLIEQQGAAWLSVLEIWRDQAATEQKIPLCFGHSVHLVKLKPLRRRPDCRLNSLEIVIRGMVRESKAAQTSRIADPRAYDNVTFRVVSPEPSW
jgi:hypothetical protein